MTDWKTLDELHRNRLTMQTKLIVWTVTTVNFYISTNPCLTQHIGVILNDKISPFRAFKNEKIR